MTDHEKLEMIASICREAFSQPYTNNLEYFRAQALANVYGIFLYDGATISNTHEAVKEYLQVARLKHDIDRARATGWECP